MNKILNQKGKSSRHFNRLGRNLKCNKDKCSQNAILIWAYLLRSYKNQPRISLKESINLNHILLPQSSSLKKIK